MNHRSLGNLPLKVSEFGFGTSRLSNTDNHHRGVPYLPLEIAKNILSISLKEGINFFDTGPHYGNTESLLGKLKTDHEFIIATKAGMQNDGSRDFSISALRKQVENSLIKINVDCLDILQLSKPSAGDLKDGSLFSFLDDLKNEGKIKYSGVVVGDIETGYQSIESGKVDCLQILYHLLYHETEELIQEASRKGLGVIIRSPLNSGLLTGTFAKNQTFGENDERSTYFSGPRFISRLNALEKIQRNLNIPNHELVEHSLRFILSNPNVSVIIPTASNTDQLMNYVNFSRKYIPYNQNQLSKIKSSVSKHMEEMSQAFQL